MVMSYLSREEIGLVSYVVRCRSHLLVRDMYLSGYRGTLLKFGGVG